MSSESNPLFKKRRKPPPSRISPPTPHPDTAAETISIDDLLTLRSLSRKPTGTELHLLNLGAHNPTQPKPKPCASQANRGGGGELHPSTLDEQSSADDGTKPKRLVRKNNFQSETGTVDVDRHMMQYIQDEMRKRSSSSTTTTTNNNNNNNNNHNQDVGTDSEDALYALAEKYKALHRSICPERSQEEREGDVAFSSAMLTSIPEVDLGIDSRMKNIQDTEHAKRRLYQNRTPREPVDDDAYTSARFQRQKRTNNISDSAHVATSRDKKPMATDHVVLDRFRKRQRSHR